MRPRDIRNLAIGELNHDGRTNSDAASSVPTGHGRSARLFVCVQTDQEHSGAGQRSDPQLFPAEAAARLWVGPHENRSAVDAVDQLGWKLRVQPVVLHAFYIVRIDGAV